MALGELVKKAQFYKRIQSLTIAILMASVAHLHANDQGLNQDEKNFFLPAGGISRPIFSFGKLALYCGFHDLYDKMGGVGFKNFEKNILNDYTGFIGLQKKYFSLIHDKGAKTTLYLFDLEKCNETKNSAQRNYADIIKALKIERNNLEFMQTDFRYIDDEGQRIFTDVFYIYFKNPDEYQNKERIARIGINDKQKLVMNDADLGIGLLRNFKSFTLFRPDSDNIVEYEETDRSEQVIRIIGKETYLKGPGLPGPLEMGQPEIKNIFWNIAISPKKNNNLKKCNEELLNENNSNELLNNLSTYFKL